MKNRTELINLKEANLYGIKIFRISNLNKIYVTAKGFDSYYDFTTKEFDGDYVVGEYFTKFIKQLLEKYKSNIIN